MFRQDYPGFFYKAVPAPSWIDYFRNALHLVVSPLMRLDRDNGLRFANDDAAWFEPGRRNAVRRTWVRRAMSQSDEIACDVLITGSGAGGLSTAITARLKGRDVIVAEKQEVFGGTTARSGG